MKLYKLTDSNGYTKNNTQWGENVTHRVSRKQNPTLCTIDVLHAYKNINLALLLNPNQGDIINPKIWEAEGEVCVEDYGKVGCFELTTLSEMPTPEWYAKNRKRVCIQFAILCAESVIHCWAKYDSEDNRPQKAIQAAKDYLKLGNKKADSAANTAYAANIATCVAACAAARAAARAAYAAYEANTADAVVIDFCKLADEAVNLES